MAFAELILRMRGRGGRGCRRGRGGCAAVAAAGVHDDAGAFPRLDEPFAGIRAVELQGRVTPCAPVEVRLPNGGQRTAPPYRHGFGSIWLSLCKTYDLLGF